MRKISFIISILLSVCMAEAQNTNQLNPTPSPDGSKTAFTRDGDLWVMNNADSSLTRLTFDGSATTLNGRASWVYYEEIFGRASEYKAFWWSPDSRKIAFYRFDESEVPTFPLFSHVGQNGSLSITRYPKAGQTNPSVQIGMIELQSSEVVWADFDADVDQYFGTPFWSSSSDRLFVSRIPRRQDTLELFAVDAKSGSKSLVYQEHYPTWVKWVEGMLFTDNGLYMVRNFESGWEQIYFLSFEGKLQCLTQGKNWETRLVKTDGKNLWFTSKRDSRLHNSFYKLDNKGKISLLSDPDFNLGGVKLSEDNKSFTATISNARTPIRQIEGRADKCDWHYIDEQAPSVPEGPLPQIVKIQNDGFDLYALISTPKNFDPSHKYPVVMQVYGGPETPYVKDTWRERDAQDQWCYDNGIIYIVCDPRSSGENGRAGMDQAFGRMTVIELQDYIAWAKYLQSLPYVEADKIGVKGFSFGGTTTSMLVLRYPEYFRCGIAGGGVYDWTLYDSHYTERYMDTPQANPEGYNTASVLNYIPKLAQQKRQALPGALRLTHGTGDDNVHLQNTLHLMDALQKIGYQFEVMLYPDGMHGYRGYQAEHDKEYEAQFWTKWLLQ